MGSGCVCSHKGRGKINVHSTLLRPHFVGLQLCMLLLMSGLAGMPLDYFIQYLLSSATKISGNFSYQDLGKWKEITWIFFVSIRFWTLFSEVRTHFIDHQKHTLGLGVGEGLSLILDLSKKWLNLLLDIYSGLLLWAALSLFCLQLWSWAVGYVWRQNCEGKIFFHSSICLVIILSFFFL